MSAAPTGASAACSSASRSSWRPPSQVGSSPSSQRGEAREAETAQLAQRLGAQALVEEDLDRSLLLARQAVAIDDTPQTRSTLLASLLRSGAAIGIVNAGEGDYVRAIAVSPDERTLAVGGLGTAGLRFFDATTHEQLGEPVPVPVAPGGYAHVEGLAYSPDGGTLAFGDAGSGYLRLVDTESRELLAETSALAARMAFTADGSKLVTVEVEDGEPITLAIRNAGTLEPIGDPIVLEGFSAEYIGSFTASPFFALTPDGRSVVTASDEGELAWWDLRTREQTRSIEIETGHHALALSPDGRTAAVGVDGGLQLVDVPSDEARLPGPPPRHRRARDGSAVARLQPRRRHGRVDHPRRGRDALGRGFGDATRDTPGPLGCRPAARLQPRWETLYTASGDGTAIAWDLTGDRGLGRPFTFTHDRAFDDYDRHPGEFSPDGRLIAVGLKERGIRLYRHDLAPAGTPLLNTGGEVKVIAFSRTDERWRPRRRAASGRPSGTSTSRSLATGRSPSSDEPITRRLSASARTARCSRPPAETASSSGTSPPERRSVPSATARRPATSPSARPDRSSHSCGVADQGGARDLGHLRGDRRRPLRAARRPGLRATRSRSARTAGRSPRPVSTRSCVSGTFAHR